MSPTYNDYTDEDFETYEDKQEQALLDNNLEDYLSCLNEQNQEELKKSLKNEAFRFEFMTFTRLTATLMYLSILKDVAPSEAINETFQKNYNRITRNWSALNPQTQKMIHFYMTNQDVEDSIVEDITSSQTLAEDLVRAKLQGLREGMLDKINV
jgi:hypothetical protein